MKKAVLFMFIVALISFNTLSFADGVDYGAGLQKLGIIKGDASGNLNGEKSLTRGELIAMISVITMKSNDTFVPPAKASFSDVPTTHWAYKFVELAKANNLTQGIGNGKFGITDQVTYRQAQAFMLNVLGYEVAWDDVAEIAFEVELTCEGAGTNKPFTRDMMFTILWRSLNKIVLDENLPLIQKIANNQFIPISEADVKYVIDGLIYQE